MQLKAYFFTGKILSVENKITCKTINYKPRNEQQIIGQFCYWIYENTGTQKLQLCDCKQALGSVMCRQAYIITDYMYRSKQ